jgi:bacteriocin-like protein
MKKLHAKEMKQIKGGNATPPCNTPECACIRRCDRIAILCYNNGGTNCDDQNAACIAAC